MKLSPVLAGRSVYFEYLFYLEHFSDLEHLSGGGSEGHDLRRLKEVARFDLI